jgi:cyclophilin family peptidyl-prolyl cis-trans isomerase
MKTLITALLFCSVFAGLGGCNEMKKTNAAADTNKTESAANSPVADGRDGVFAVIETSRGTIVAELFYKQTPLTVINFAGLAEGTLDAAQGKPFYDGVLFHRVISRANGDADDFMIQTGDPLSKDPARESSWGTGGPGYKFADEFVSGLKHDVPGKLSMANSGAGTNGSQFFITIVPTPWLDGRHTVFGQVIHGQDIVNKTQQKDIIKKITIVRQGEEAKQFKATQAEWNALNEAVRQKALNALADERKKTEAEAHRKFPAAQTSPEGILFVVTRQGSGQAVGKGKTVQAHYKGYFLTDEVFDSSAGRDPIAFITGAGQMIPGFDIMVQGMKIGEKRTIVIPPEQAYGAQGAGGVIPPNAFICFDIELMSAR